MQAAYGVFGFESRLLQQGDVFFGRFGPQGGKAGGRLLFGFGKDVVEFGGNGGAVRVQAV